MNSKFKSRKFLVFILNFIAIFILSLLGKIESLYAIIGLLINGFLYTAIEGVIDLKSVRKIQVDGFNLEKEGKK